MHLSFSQSALVCIDSKHLVKQWSHDRPSLPHPFAFKSPLLTPPSRHLQWVHRHTSKQVVSGGENQPVDLARDWRGRSLHFKRLRKKKTNMGLKWIHFSFPARKTICALPLGKLPKRLRFQFEVNQRLIYGIILFTSGHYIKNTYCIAGNFQMVQIFAYFEHLQIVQKLELTKIFVWEYEITRFYLARQLFVDYGAQDVPINIVAAYHRLDGERSMHHESKCLK